jgi:transcriptional regulator with XRE-family HTH domain
MRVHEVPRAKRLAFGRELRGHREARGWTRTELAYHCGRSVHTVEAWECGHRFPSLATLHALADLFGSTTTELLGEAPVEVS